MSLSAARPPKPPHLASPACFPHQELGPSDKLYVSKRDASCFFDQLALPDCLVPFMGRPWITRDELLGAGMTESELSASLRPDTDSDAVGWHPVSLVWCMGFSWSSTVGQQTLLSICAQAGLTQDLIISPDGDIPHSLRLQYAVATDDAMIFSTNASTSVAAASRLDGALDRAGIMRNTDKDVNGACDATCVGVDLVDGCRWEAPAARSYYAVADLLELLSNPSCSPLAMASYLGGVQWYDLLCRPKLACYNTVYGFLRLQPQRSARPVPAEILEELLLSVALTPWWAVDLRREFAPLMLATDASTSFGFGAAVADASTAELRKISRLCSLATATALSSRLKVSPAPRRTPAASLGAGIGSALDVTTSVQSLACARVTKDT